MPGTIWWICGGALVVLTLAGCWGWGRWRRVRRRNQQLRARRDFHLQRERLECLFLEIASHSGKPRGLRWVDVDFDDDVTYACDRASGELSAFVGVTIRFEAVVGGDLEDNPNANRLRAGTAVFTFNGKVWGTRGRAIFNLNPTEAIEHLRDSLIMVGEERK